MSNGTEFVFGFILWLISCSFVLSLYHHKNQLKSELDPKKSLNCYHPQNLSSPKNLPSKQNKTKSNYHRETEINPLDFKHLQEELRLAQEKIRVLSSELETKSNQLLLAQHRPSKLETKLRQENQELQAKIINLKVKYQQLKTNFTKQSEQIKNDFKNRTFKQLYSLLINYPTAKIMTEVKPNLPAKHLIALFKPLDHLLNNWGIYPIGKAWDKVIYNPQLHKPDSLDIQKGEPVYIRFIGYRYGDRVLYPAKVSRTLIDKPTK